MKSNSRKEHFLFVLLLTGYIIFYIACIAAESFVFEGQRIYPLFEDAMISMRYAYNLVHGNGLVWNPGERVEGFSHLFWIGFLSIPHLLGVSLYKAGLVIQIINLGLNLASILIVRKVILKTTQAVACIYAEVMLICSLPLTYWAVAGLENSLLVLCVSTSLFLASGWIGKSKGVSKQFCLFGVFGPYVFAGIAYGIRPDAMVLFGSLVLWRLIIILNDRSFKMIDSRVLIDLILGISVIIGIHAFRWSYYHELFPNPYYVKMTLGAKGNPFLYLLRNVTDPFWAVFILGSICAFKHRKSTNSVLFLITGAFYFVYLLYTGGDYLGSNRYLVCIYPYIVTFCTVYIIPKIEDIRMMSRSGILILGIIFYVGGVSSAGSVQILNRFKSNIYLSEKALIIAKVIKMKMQPADGVIAVAAAGCLPYFMPEYRFLDILGLTDHHIARVRAHVGPPVGHNKWDVKYVVDVVKPAVIVDVAYVPLKDDPAFVEFYQPNFVIVRKEDGIGFWMRQDRSV